MFLFRQKRRNDFPLFVAQTAGVRHLFLILALLKKISNRLYIVEPTGLIEDDANLMDKKYPGNPTQSYRSQDPLRVTGEVMDWQGHSPEQLKAMQDNLERLRQLVVEAIED
ncbi:NAD(+)--rifampin ADP-ribosyltransferase [Cyanobacteria bacterium FACHB-63]|nr:NAD(+)--rifampin ADP-ribosyltransferase [Cyanobacteria bacterium FACHB-63]